jgi:enamine deaminase RidA (YjgF/YER057c/UK114 family)
MTTSERLRFLGIALPPAPRPAAKYATFVHTGHHAYVSGHGPLRLDGSYVIGKVGAEVELAAAIEAARLTGVAVLATLADHGVLDRVVSVVKILGFVNATPDFTDHPAVIDGFSSLMVDVFGNAGLAARSAVGAPSLPRGIAVEVEAMFELR